MNAQDHGAIDLASSTIKGWYRRLEVLANNAGYGTLSLAKEAHEAGRSTTFNEFGITGQEGSASTNIHTIRNAGGNQIGGQVNAIPKKHEKNCPEDKHNQYT